MDHNNSQASVSNIPKTMQGKVAIVTGATAGIGEITASSLAEKGATVLIIRDSQRLESTVQKITQETGNPHVKSLKADLSSLTQVNQLAGQILQQVDHIDVLVNNAGANYFRRKTSADGYEMTFALNHLSYFYLTQLLLGLLQSTAKERGEARIVNLASEAHRSGTIAFDDLMFERRIYDFGGWRAYSQSKLANVLFTFELSRRLQGSMVSVNAVHPGLVATNLGHNNGWGARFIMRAVQLFAISSQEGAQTSIYLASWPELKGVSGHYFYKCQPIKAAKPAYDLAAAQRLWDVSEELIQNAI